MKILVACLWLSIVANPFAQDPAEGDAETRKRVEDLILKADQLLTEAKFSEARSVAEEALRTAEAQLGPEDADTAKCLNMLGLVVWRLGDAKGARAWMERALAIREEVLGPDRAETAQSLDNLGLVCTDLQEWAEARRLHERALAIREKALGPEHPATATSLNNLASLLWRIGDLEPAKTCHLRALEIRRKVLGPDDPRTALSHYNLGAVQRALGEFTEARRSLEQSLEIREKSLGPSHPLTAQSLNSLAGLLGRLGDLDRAIPLCERALAIRRQAFGSDHPETAQNLNSLGWLHQRAGDLRAARPLFEQAAAIQAKVLGPEHHSTLLSQHNVAFVLYEMGDRERARPLLERVLALQAKVLGPDHQDTLNTLTNLGALLQDAGDLDGAQACVARVLAATERRLGADHPDFAIALADEAELLLARGHVDDAIPAFKRAIVMLEKRIGSDHPWLARPTWLLAAALRQRGELEASRKQYERALSIVANTDGEDHPATALIRNGLGEVLRRTGDAPAASLAFEQAWEVNRQVIQGLLPSLSCEQRRKLLSARRWQFESYVAGRADEPERTYGAALAWKGVALRTGRAAERLPEGATAKLREAVERLADARRSLAALLLSVEEGPQAGKSSPAMADQLREEIGSLESWVAEEAPDLAARAFLNVAVRDVTRSLPDGTVLLDLLDNGKNLHAWVVSREKETRYVLLGKAAEFEPLAARFREALESDDEKAWRSVGTELRTRLAPALDAALEGTRTLYLSPDGALATIPWGLLPEGDDEKPRFLIERLPIVHVHGGAGLVMSARTEGEKRGEGLLALGDVDYAGLDAAPPALPATGPEVERIAALYEGETRVLMGKEASRAAFEREAPRARYVHVATHGFFDLANLRVAVAGTRGFTAELSSSLVFHGQERRTPGGGWNPLLLSGIVLAKGDGREGYLTAEELQSLDLRGVELVVLSACETGRGELAAGEGVLGLSRALAIAGARGFMLSLWKVPDERTRELMEAFYAGMWKEGLAPEEALRRAQLGMIERDRASEAFHPGDWGAWVLMR